MNNASSVPLLILLPRLFQLSQVDVCQPRSNCRRGPKLNTPRSDGAPMSAFSSHLDLLTTFSCFISYLQTHNCTYSCNMAHLTPPQTTASKLRALLAKENEIVVCPGVYDGFTARLALNAGFKILYMVSFLLTF
jgi:hypothetical protein